MKINKVNHSTNKLPLITVEDIDSNSVSIMILVRVGSRYEDEKIAGLAHFVEHNFFKGTKKLPTSKDIGMAMEKLGGTSNAFTSYEYTGYYIKVPKENFDDAIEVLSDLIQNATFPKEDVEKERGVVIEEIRMYEDIPMQRVAQTFMTDLFGKNHPLGRDIAGTVESVSSLGRDEIIDFTKKYYSSENMLVVISGGISFERAKSKFEEKFAIIENGKKSEYETFDNHKINSKVNIQNKKIEQSHIVLGGFGYKRSAEERHALKVGLTILGKGFGSILFQSIREKLALAYYIRSDHSSFYETGVWEVSMGIDNKRILEATGEVLDRLKDFIDGKFDDEDMLRSKNYIIGNLVTGLETSDDIAQWYGIQELLLEKIYTADDIKKSIELVTKDQIIDVWRQIVRGDNLMFNMISPVEGLENQLNDLIVSKLG